MWMIRSGSGGERVNDAIEKGIIAIGWNEIDAGNFSDKAAIVEAIKQCWSTWPKGKVNSSASMLYKFVHAIKIGDKVVTYDSSARFYYIGEIVGDHIYISNLDHSDGYANTRKVKWNTKPILRDHLSTATKNTLGSTLTLFKLPEFAEEEMLALLKGKEVNHLASSEEEAEIEEIESNFENVHEKSLEFIKDRLMKLDWEAMQELVAGILRAMGYKTRVSPSGSDRGKDIIASPDGLGFEQPRICVEVKHRPGSQMGSQEIRSFLGGRHKDDKGLYVSTGGFSKEARYEADRATIPLTLMDSADLVKIFVENYDKMDSESHSLLPLGKIYWPV